MDYAILFIVLLCCIAGFALYYVAKIVFLLLYVVALSISYTRWCLRTISTNGQITWHEMPFAERCKAILIHVWESIPTVMTSGEITKGTHYWRSILDHNP